jgi:hypothetical protein
MSRVYDVRDGFRGDTEGLSMITFRISAEVHDDRRITLVLPADVPTGTNEFIVSVAPVGDQGERRPRSSLADWAEAEAEHWGTQLSASDVESFTGRRF